MAKTRSRTSGDLAAVLERLSALEQRIARLEGDQAAAVAVAGDFRVAPEALAAPAAAPAGAARTAEGPVVTAPLGRANEEIGEEIFMVITAAVAAFLGERGHVRQVRLLHSDAWAQQGRVSVMASHRWAVQR